MLRTMKQLLGFDLGAQDGVFGRVKDFYFDDGSWTVRYVVADTGNWLVGRQVLISPAAVGLPENDWRILSTKLTKGQIENSPSIEEDRPVSRQHEIDYSAYYGWPAYWEGPYLWGGATVPFAYPPSAGAVAQQRAFGEATEAREEEKKGDPHLRSFREVTGYHLQARDGEIGHAADFLIDERTWGIRYLVVDTRNWWPGKKVLVSPAWIESVIWSEGKVGVRVLREDIRQAPEYIPGMPLTEDLRRKLDDYYEETLRLERR